MKVSILLPTLDCKPWLDLRLESIRSQTYQDYEVIVGDSGSTDGTREALELIAGSDARWRIIDLPRHGLYAAWNDCLAAATGDLIYVATADDTADSQLLERLTEALERHPEAGIAVCDFQEIDEHGNPSGREDPLRSKLLGGRQAGVYSGREELAWHFTFNTLWHTMTSLLIRREVFDKVGPFRTDVRWVADALWTWEACARFDFVWVPGKLATWRRRPGQASPSDLDMEAAHLLWTEGRRLVEREAATWPEPWRTPQAKTVLTDFLRVQWAERAGMYRWRLRSDMGGFLRDCRRVARVDRGWLVGRLMRGFGDDGACTHSRGDHARRLADVLGLGRGLRGT